jgi:murein L,D-transpeptidase YcbB/YkuD
MIVMTLDENKARVNGLKQALAGTDYKALKASEGIISADEYAPTKTQRQAWRDEINELETAIEEQELAEWMAQNSSDV